MGLTVEFNGADRGITAPYPPLKDQVRNNRGFIDMKGRPEVARTVEETIGSPALATLLEFIAQKDSGLISLGCDLGRHTEQDQPRNTRRVAGGYVQFALEGLEDNTPDRLLELAKEIGRAVESACGSSYWHLNFVLTFVNYKFHDSVEAYSIWLWFFASSSSFPAAEASREQLIQALTEGMTELQSNSP